MKSDIVELNARLMGERYPYEDIDNLFASCVLHVIVGQLPNILSRRFTLGGNKHDLRIHSTIISPSGTNKGSVFNYAGEISKKLGLVMEEMGSITDSSLIGTYDQEDVLIPGLLHPYSKNNILAWSEGSDVLDASKSQFSEHILTILQKAMNPMDTSDNIVSKSTGLKHIATNTSCSIMGVTYPPRTLTSKVMETGYLQRQLVLIHTPTIAENYEVSKMASRILQTKSDPISMDLLVQMLQEVNAFAGRHGKLTWDETLIPACDMLNKNIYLSIYQSHVLCRDVLNAFAKRWTGNIFYTLCFHHALLRKSFRVEAIDYLYASNLMEKLWDKMRLFIERRLVKDSKEVRAIRKEMEDINFCYTDLITQDCSWVRRKDLVNHLSRLWGTSLQTTEEMLDEHEFSMFHIKQLTAISQENAYLRKEGYLEEELDTEPAYKIRDDVARGIYR